MEDLEKDLPDPDEAKSFVSIMVPLLSPAMKLRTQPIEHTEFYPMEAQKSTKGSALGAALKAAYLAGESPAPGIAYLPG